MTVTCDVRELGYGALSERMHDRIVSERIPADGTLELTYRCNLSCVQCYCNVAANDGDALARELTTEEIFRILDEVTEAGTLWLLLTGGEILLRRDFLDIYRHAKRCGLLLTLFTNGIGLDERLADALAEEPPFAAEITLYGATEGTYRRVTLRSGGFARATQAVDRLLARGIRPTLKATILTENAHELAAMRRFALDRGLRFRFTAELTPRIDRVGKPVGTRLAPEEIVETDRADPVRWEQLRRTFEAAGRDGLADPSPDLFHCNAGVTGYNITPYGRLLFCPSMEALGTDLRRIPFREAWAGFATYRKLQAPERACNECILSIACGACPGNSHLEHADMRQGAEFYHRLTGLRARAFGLRIRENAKGAWVNEEA